VPDLLLERRDASGAMDLLDALADIYVEAYAEEPYEGDPVFSRTAFIQRLSRQVHSDGFTLVTGQLGGNLAGYTFGLHQDAGRWLPGESSPPPPAEVVKSARFFIVELVVARPFRRLHCASRLMDAITAGRPEPFAALAAHPHALARVMYQRWGWQEVCKLLYADGAAIFDVMIKQLDSAVAATNGHPAA
jgi:hypothetical protein